MAIFAGFCLGYIAQWMAFNYIRATGLLDDIDKIVLCNERWHYYFGVGSIQDNQSKYSSFRVTFQGKVVIAIFLHLLLCQQQVRARELIDLTEPAEQYFTDELAFITGLMYGIVIGISLQYLLIIAWRDGLFYDEFISICFIPHVWYTMAYSITEYHNRLLGELDSTEQILKARQRPITLDSFAYQTAIAKSICTDNKTNLRRIDYFVRLARWDADGIIANATYQYIDIFVLHKTKIRFGFRCMECNQRGIYFSRRGNCTISCPRYECSGVIRIPHLRVDTEREVPNNTSLAPALWVGPIQLHDYSWDAILEEHMPDNPQQKPATLTSWDRVDNRNVTTEGSLASAQKSLAFSDENVNTPKFHITLPDTDSLGIMTQWKRKEIDRKTALAAVQAKYDQQLEALKYQLQKAVSVSNAQADRIAEEYLKKLDTEHLRVLKEFGLKNAETRATGLIQVRDMIAAKLREVMSKDWPKQLIDRTIDDLINLEKRVCDEMMRELGE